MSVPYRGFGPRKVRGEGIGCTRTGPGQFVGASGGGVVEVVPRISCENHLIAGSDLQPISRAAHQCVQRGHQEDADQESRAA